MDKSSKSKGYLNEISDSLLTNSNFSNTESQNIFVSKINEIKFRRKGKPGRGALYGALIGTGLGALIGVAAGSDKRGFVSFNASDKAIIIGTVFAIPGAIIGAIAGHAFIVKIPIRGDKKKA